MSHLVIRNDPTFFLAEDPVFLLLTHKHDFHSLEQIFLGNHVSSVLDCQNGSFINHIGQIGTYRTAGCQRDRFQIHGFVQMHILGMHLQDIHTAFQIRLVHDNSPVKTARTQQRLIQHLRPVGGRQDQQTLGRVKTIHLGQQLVQRLFPLIVAAAQSAVAAFADGIDLINENDTGRHLLGFLKQIADTGSTHPHEHFHKIRTGQGEEGHVGLSCHRFCQQGLTGSRRAHQQRALGQLGTDLRIFTGVMQEIHHFLQGFLGLVLTGHILERHTGLLLHINLRLALADAHHTAASGHAAHDEHIGAHHKNDGDQIAQDAVQHGARCIRHLPGVSRHTVLRQHIFQILIRKNTGVICHLGTGQPGAFLLIRILLHLKGDPVRLHDDTVHLAVLHQFHELGIGNLLFCGVRINTAHKVHG